MDVWIASNIGNRPVWDPSSEWIGGCACQLPALLRDDQGVHRTVPLVVGCHRPSHSLLAAQVSDCRQKQPNLQCPNTGRWREREPHGVAAGMGTEYQIHGGH